MGAQAPQWLLTSFVDAMQQIGATATQSELETESVDLAERWSAPERQMHNLRRLMNTLPAKFLPKEEVVSARS